MKRLFYLSFILLLLACETPQKKSNPYLDSTKAERAGFKRVALPLNDDQSFMISQGAFGCCTHDKPGYEYAWDFDVPYGTQVRAVEAGEVIQVWEPNLGGGCDSKFLETAHNIKVLHTDGTIAQYVHIQSQVRIGNKVRKNQVIAVTANNGFLCIPHLHFNVFQDRKNIPETGSPRTIPVLFENASGDGLLPEGFSKD